MISIRILEGDFDKVTGTLKGYPIEIEVISPTVTVGITSLEFSWTFKRRG